MRQTHNLIFRRIIIVYILSLLFIRADAQDIPPLQNVTEERTAPLSEITSNEPDKEPDCVLEQSKLIKEDCEKLLLNIRSNDTDTGELPEVFSVYEKNEDLDKLLVLKEKGIEYLAYLLKDLKNGYLKERIARSLEYINDERVIDALLIALKDKSSAVRLRASKTLGKSGDLMVIPKLTSLLWDGYALRKDVYPVRTAAREAIALIKLREEIKQIQNDEERVRKLMELLKEKALLKEEYFCEYLVSELSRYNSGKELVWDELQKIKGQEEKTSYGKDRITGYFMEILANQLDERSLPIIEEAMKEPSLYWAAVRSLNKINKEKLLDIILKEPVNSELVKLILNMIKTEAEKQNLLEYETIKTSQNKALEEEYILKTKKLLLLNRNADIYKKIAKAFMVGLNNYKRAEDYLRIYESTLVNISYDEVYISLLAECLANSGRFIEAKEINPALDTLPYMVYLPLIENLNKKAGEDIQCKKLWYMSAWCMEIKQYRNAIIYLRQLIDVNDCKEPSKKEIESNIKVCEEKIKEETDIIFNSTYVVTEQDVQIEMKEIKDNYKVNEDVKGKIIIKNLSNKTVYILNDTEGYLGFDVIVMRDGYLIKRLKTNFSDQQPAEEELVPKIIVVEPLKQLESDFTFVNASDLIPEGEYEIILSYVGGKALRGYEDGWVSGPLISSNLTIKINK